jgi:hypothetical protein
LPQQTLPAARSAARAMRLLPLLLVQAVAKSKYDVVDRDDATTFGILIDAGSTGSRVHIYQWEKRDFNTLPPPLSLPLTSERWTERIKPGLSDYNDDAERAARTLIPLIETAKRTLGNYKHAWSSSVRKSTSAPGAPWRGGRRDDSARTRRKILISTQVVVSYICQSYRRDAGVT